MTKKRRPGTPEEKAARADKYRALWAALTPEQKLTRGRENDAKRDQKAKRAYASKWHFSLTPEERAVRANKQRAASLAREAALTDEQRVVIREKRRAASQARREDTRAYYRFKTYGITPYETMELRAKAGNACMICRKPEAEMTDKQGLCVDHDHGTGVIRGLLCNNCNRALGLLGDTLERLETAAAYIRASMLPAALEPAATEAA